MQHDFHRFPELANSQMARYYLQSPHKQILYDFRGIVVKVVDGDTIRVECSFRDFGFPVRMLDTNAPEMNERGGQRSKSWLENQILGKEVQIEIDPKQRVGKWGRLLGTIHHNGLNINEMSIKMGMATTFEDRKKGKIPRLDEVFPKCP